MGAVLAEEAEEVSVEPDEIEAREWIEAVDELLETGR
jgi:hypothetical protein